MDRSTAIRQLPEPYAVAIRLRDEDFDDHVIAIALEVEDNDVRVLLEIANSKLTGLMALEHARTH